MIDTKGNAQMRGHLSANITKHSDCRMEYAFIKTLLQWVAAIFRIDLGIAIWTWTYRLEEAREKHASSRNLIREAACRFGLALLRILVGR